MSRGKLFEVQEFGGNQYPSLGAAQGRALKAVGATLTRILRELLDDGWLENKNGRIILRSKRGRT
jgi:hypothetical protein